MSPPAINKFRLEFEIFFIREPLDSIKCKMRMESAQSGDETNSRGANRRRSSTPNHALLHSAFDAKAECQECICTESTEILERSALSIHQFSINL